MAHVGFYEMDKPKQEEFLEQLRLHGLDPARVIGLHLDTAANHGTLRINADLADSHLVTHYRTVYNVAELKRLAGAKPSASQALKSNVVYPAPPKFDAAKLANRYSNPRELSAVLGPEGRATVKQAAVAYLTGDHKQVSDAGYEPIINALHFPAQLVTGAADSITVQNGQTVKFGAPGHPVQALTVADIVMYGTGSLQFLSDYTLTCVNKMQQQPPANG